MEATGLAVGVVGLFSVCLDTCNYIAAMGRYDADLEHAAIKLRIELFRLEHTKNTLSARSDRRQIGGQSSSISQSDQFLEEVVLPCIKKILDEIKALVVKNINQNTIQGPTSTSSFPITPSASPSVSFTTNGSNDSGSSTPIRGHSTNSKLSSLRRAPIVRKIKWIAGDKELLAACFERLAYYTDAVISLAASEAEREGGFSYRVRHAALTAPGSNDEAGLTTLQEACVGWRPEIARAAGVKRLLLLSRANNPSRQGEGQQQLGIGIDRIRWEDPRGLGGVTDKDWTLGTLERAPGGGTCGVLVEWRGAFMSTRDAAADAVPVRLETLCSLLKAMHDANMEENAGESDASTTRASSARVDFGMLQCLGWTLASPSSYKRIGLVFRYPSSVPSSISTRAHSLPSPRSLRDYILDTRRRNAHAPDLGSRFGLASRVVSALANILAVGWVHRAVRSSNVMLFDDAPSSSSSVGNLLHGRVYLVGLTYARDGDALAEFSRVPEPPDAVYFRPTQETYSSDSDSDDYLLSSNSGAILSTDALSNRGDEQSASPSPMAIDMFGVGMILLEIGLWQTADRLARSRDNAGGVRRFLTHGVRDVLAHLLSRCGSIYHSVVERCLAPEIWDAGDAIERELAGVLTDLKKCTA